MSIATPSFSRWTDLIGIAISMCVSTTCPVRPNNQRSRIMIKRVNFTGRRRINQSCTEIEVYDGSPRTFDASIDLSASRMPASAKVFLEAMCAGSSVVQRFDFGTVSQVQPPAQRTLELIEGENVFFALKVVDETESMG